MCIAPIEASSLVKIIEPYHVAKHMRGVLFLVRLNNFDWTLGFYWSYTLFL